MLRGWLTVLAVLVGVGFSFAADSRSPLVAEKKWEEARKSLANGHPAQAKAAFEELLKKYPHEARTLLGWIDSEIRGDFDSAIREYAKVVELRPDLAEAYNNLGVAQKRKGELDKAAASFNKALARRPDYSAALSNRGGDSIPPVNLGK